MAKKVMFDTASAIKTKKTASFLSHTEFEATPPEFKRAFYASDSQHATPTRRQLSKFKLKFGHLYRLSLQLAHNDPQ